VPERGASRVRESVYELNRKGHDVFPNVLVLRADKKATASPALKGERHWDLALCFQQKT